MHRDYQPGPEHSKRPIRWLSLLPWIAVAYALTGFYSVKPDEWAVVRRCGRALPELRRPGLHFGFPYGIDRVTRLKVAGIKRAGVGMSLSERVLGRRARPQDAECLTGDRNLILASAIVQYKIADRNPTDHLFNVADVSTLVSNVAAGTLSSVVSSMNVDDVLTVERIAIQEDVKRATQTLLDRCGAGVEVTSVTLEDVTPPQEVAEAFRDVTSARGDRQRLINEAEGYARRLDAMLEGETDGILNEAKAFAVTVTQKAKGDADAFNSIVAQLSLDRQLTVKRLILETMEEVLPRLKKIILEPGAAGTIDVGLIEENL